MLMNTLRAGGAALAAATGFGANAQFFFVQDTRGVETSAEATNLALPKGERTQSLSDHRQPGGPFLSFWDVQLTSNAARAPGTALARAAQISKLDAYSIFAWGDASTSVSNAGAPGVSAIANGVSHVSIGFTLAHETEFRMDIGLLSEGGSSAEALLIGQSGLIVSRFATNGDDTTDVVKGVLPAGTYQFSVAANSLVSLDGPGDGTAFGACAFTVKLSIPGPGGGAALGGLFALTMRRRRGEAT